MPVIVPEPPASGPTWKWLVGLLMTIVGVGMGGWMASVWGQLDNLGENVGVMRNTLVVISEKLDTAHENLSAHSAQIQKLWDALAVEHDKLMECQQRMKAAEADHEMLINDDTLLHNYVHPDRDPRKQR